MVLIAVSGFLARSYGREDSFSRRCGDLARYEIILLAQGVA
jgi:hypothetical protein